ncbi:MULTISPECIES: twin-arginine translocation signal domain-containing protein [unclassified Cyanobium]|uniref:twin-arginine translocation signal domain-containing protein n=1 Tax=unclassified Cyanobium TaxID=2627006 RepID=UPI0020CFA01C|nr:MULTISPECIES: twin-arginine translocation signal domain-containing protein [unclassified Cyanobium]MCP9833524.1 twin-arginine translocation signal domain-containing protein [Cyanobium sp. La Preciosa 7G6]MCP9936289.1 twin-arginine translocation signal domain-containing protein [Cyanobium sp. Aljojuca 7A6]
MTAVARLTRRSFLVLAAVAGLAAIGAGVAFQEHTRNALTVSNSSGRTITALEVSLPWQTLRFEPIADGDVVTQSFQIKFDAQFEISGQLADGTPIRSSQGYVTNGHYGEAVRIEVGPHGEVRFTQQTRRLGRPNAPDHPPSQG